MTDNQDSVSASAVQPPTDRPLTAGVWVVTASCGEYSDRAEWTVSVHWSEAEGRAEVERLDGEDRQTRKRGHDETAHYLSGPFPLAALASPPVSERERELEGALRLAANRMDRLALEVQFDTRLRAEAAEWVAEARALTAQPAGGVTHG